MVNTRKITLSLLLSSLMISSCFGAENLGIIGIDSTTIDDRFHPTRTEVSSTSTIEGKKVDEAHIENLQQVLQSIPGITSEIKAGDSLKIHIRGVENQRYMGEKPGVAVVIDGVPVFERTGSVNIDLDNIASIKVIKGGASYLFGDDALAGAVIITTKKGAVSKSMLSSEFGSFGYQKLLAETSFAKDSFNGRIQISERKSDGYWKDSDYLSRYANGKLQYYIDDTSDLTFGLEASQREKDSHGTVEGMTQALTDPTSVAGRDYSRMYDVDLLKLFLTYAKDFGNNSNLLVNVYQYGDDTQFVSSPQKYSSTGTAVTDSDAYTTLNDYHQVQRGLKSEYRGNADTLAYMIGADIRNNIYENKTSYLVDFRTRPTPPTYYAGTVTGDNETTEEVYAPYLEIKVPLSEATTLTLNGRYDNIRLDYDDHLNALSLQKDFDVYSHRIGVSHTLNESTTLFFSRSTGFRAPSIDQLFNGSITLDSKVLNNPDLKPEQAINYDLGIRGTLPALENTLTYEATLFLLDRKDYIMSSIGQYTAATTANPQKYENIGGMRSQGLELSLQSDPKKTFSFDLAYTYLDAYFTQYDNFYLGLGNPYVTSGPTAYTQVHYDLTGNAVPRTSHHTLNLTGNYNITPSTVLSTEWTLKSSYYADELNQLKMPGYGVFNLLAKHSETWGDFTFDLFARIDNVFNKFYFNTARSSNDRDYNKIYNQEDLSLTVNPGRVYTAGLSVKF
ncbi:TonB-dependent receptor [Sulfuricurvum sp. RIFCSPLOWO2_12_FULL_43_24]|uniref:TonB-dependent receptor n=1 Tax=Sulfuricurvum sp. RIFCSPLOWO2_12_FULL_43_24 TaxID=1802247 RepID=UPI0008C33562|nr:TonB-dependent receptor [Sulfuricurvum sp. RIFCSPLOWO2_12_FULL_43_24]OHD88518.1 MAG: TonB-dependent receptor [Sulfuricurvum sp. RIFCSPLOWO2_12_FULL_43_24]